MELISITLKSACRDCGSFHFRMEAERRDDCPVICAQCGHFAGCWGALRANGVVDLGADVSTVLTGVIGRTLRNRRRR